MWDFRFFRVIEAVAALGGKHRLIPEAVFPSLRKLSYGEDLDDYDPHAAFDQIRATLQAAAGQGSH